ncbi:cbb3-type cytochrome oxidase assembly protein CcoS [Mariprofundus sp. EBB-1]|uniref:cbb3-type cytochrome oxidase assembly protein CcoS n=1 Tax=Mariprofundus sp. EBB-1 TaxID=2650971 RepID=UPI000EF25D55|nr:cbb3-type cytochrome oxidase assembly protein CcoS [Mariprofundus sp. EBB-1]RLL52834.1 cbb3-type cytochrome oxidase assembly protein CcoS [Mariprofundus sp. EBB-1]
MSVIYGLIPGMILLGLVSVLVFFWAVKNGQYDDMEGPAHRILDDDDVDQTQNNTSSTTTDKPNNFKHD